jgi:hypothetical protein
LDRAFPPGLDRRQSVLNNAASSRRIAVTAPTKPTHEDPRIQTVLNAFDSLFNKRDYASTERFWSPRYIQHIFRPAVTGSSAWSRPCRRRFATRTISQRRPVSSSFSMGASAATACRQRGSSLTSCAWRMECWPSTGTSSRTKPRGSNRRAICRCSAKSSRLDRWHSSRTKILQIPLVRTYSAICD